MADATFEKAMKLAVVTGLRSMLGPALVARSTLRPGREKLAMAAMGEMVADKLPLMPSRDTLPSLIVRGLAGAWVAKTLQEDEGDDNPWVVPLGAAVAIGVAVAAPKIRRTLEATTGVSDVFVGLAEDYLALRLGGEAVGLSMEDLSEIARESVEDLRDRIRPVVDDLKERIRPAVQSAGAGSM